MLHAMALSFRTASRFSWLVKSKGHILKVKIGRNTAIFATQPSYLNLPVRSITGTSISEAKSKPTKWPEEIALKDDTEQKIKWLASGSAMEMKPLQFFEQLCNFPTPQLTRVKERAELLEQLRDKPIAKYLNESKIPIHPINGKVDFRFLQEPFFADDPVIETLRLMVKPKQGQTVTLVGQSGIGKIGAIFAFAQKQYVLYIEANPCKKQNSFSEFYLHGQKIMQIIAQMGTECSSSLATDLMTCLTQLLWLSHALVLKQQCPFVSPVGWIALESDECQDIKDTMNKLGTWFIEDLKANNCNKDWVAQKHREFDECLRELTQDVVFVIDEAHLAQGLFEESLPTNIKFVNALCNEKRNFLTILAHYSLPNARTLLVVGTQITSYDDISLTSGESKPSNNINLTRVQFPLVHPEDAIRIATDLFPSIKGNKTLEQSIVNAATGHLGHITSLLEFICNYSHCSESKSLSDFILLGIEAWKQKVQSEVHEKLNSLHLLFSTNENKKHNWQQLLLQLYYDAAISSERRIPEQEFKALGVSLEDLSVAMVTEWLVKLKIDTDNEQFFRYINICEPLAFEIFKNWLTTNSDLKDYVDEFEALLEGAVGTSFNPTPNINGDTFARLLGALLLNLSTKNQLKIKQLPIINSLEHLPDWTESIAFQTPWNFFGKATECQELLDAVQILREVDITGSPTAMLRRQFRGSPALSCLFKNRQTMKKELEALIAIKSCDQEFQPELLMMLTGCDKALVMPSKFIGPDLIGIKGNVLYLVGVYCYSSPTIKEQFDALGKKQDIQLKKFNAMYTNRHGTPYPANANSTLQLILKAKNYHQVWFDIRLPQTNADVSSVANDRLHVLIMQDNFGELTLSPQKWAKIAAKLAYKTLQQCIEEEAKL